MQLRLKNSLVATSGLVLGLSAVDVEAAFTSTAPSRACSMPSASALSLKHHDEFGDSSAAEGAMTTSSRRDWFRNVAVVTGSTFGAVAMWDVSPVSAAVFLDPDRYGDKELKIATVNKLRQNVRDAILKDPTLAPLFVKVAIQDALTYDAKDETGGPDGSIVSSILASDAPASLKGLKPAAEQLSAIAAKIKRTTEITMADVVTFAGAEAIESAGGPRIVVQLGKTDPRPSKKGSTPTTTAYPDLCGQDNGKEVVSAFLNTGLTEREVAILYGVVGAMEKVVSNVETVVEEEEEENEMGDKDIFIPSSFGGPKEIYGKQLGKMDDSVFVSVKEDLNKGRKPISDVFAVDLVGNWANKYAGNKSGFIKDLPEAYGKLMGLGTRYTGGKVGSLLGAGDSDY
eukprot:scaffold3698_cov43-Attheya_sp.AAC.2